VQIEGCEDRESARELIGIEIAIRPEQLGKLHDGEYYWHQLEGLTVVNVAGDNLGTVERLMETGANDVLVVRGEKERLIPYTPTTIAEVDLSTGQIKVEWELDY
jgi:16S rRNA processing protein RimM